MDIVPILTVILLAVTILTLILSVFAYVLYKLKERRNNNKNNKHKVIGEAHEPPLQKEIVVIPSSAGLGSSIEGGNKKPGESIPEPLYIARKEEGFPLFWRYTPKGYVPVTDGTERIKTDELKWR
ncbi:MAG: hypothetical protein ABIK47_07630 [candidate division WOR-3 bacterium]